MFWLFLLKNSEMPVAWDLMPQTQKHKLDCSHRVQTHFLISI